MGSLWDEGVAGGCGARRPGPRLRLRGWALESAYDCGVCPESHLTHKASGVSAILRCEFCATHCASSRRKPSVVGRCPPPPPPPFCSPKRSEWKRHEPSPGWPATRPRRSRRGTPPPSPPSPPPARRCASGCASRDLRKCGHAAVACAPSHLSHFDEAAPAAALLPGGLLCCLGPPCFGLPCCLPGCCCCCRGCCCCCCCCCCLPAGVPPPCGLAAWEGVSGVSGALPACALPACALLPSAWARASCLQLPGVQFALLTGVASGVRPCCGLPCCGLPASGALAARCWCEPLPPCGAVPPLAFAATAALAAAKAPTFLVAAGAACASPAPPFAFFAAGATDTASAPDSLFAAFGALALGAERPCCEAATRASGASARAGVVSVRCFFAAGSTAAARRTPLGVPAAATPPPSTSALRRVLGGEPFFEAPPSLGSGAGDAAASARFGGRRSESALLKVAGSLATRTVGDEARGVPLGGVMLLRCCFGRLALKRLPDERRISYRRGLLQTQPVGC